MTYYILGIILAISISANIFLLISFKKSLNYIEFLESWMIDFKNLIKNTYNKLKSLDDRNIFEKDDDVGFLFSELIHIMEITNQKIQNDYDVKATNEKKEK